MSAPDWYLFIIVTQLSVIALVLIGIYVRLK
jgi:hypothetical protein